MYEVEGVPGWDIAAPYGTDELAHAAHVARGTLDADEWRDRVPFEWDGEPGEIPVVTTFLHAGIAFRAGADAGLDHFFGQFRWLRLGGEAEGYVVPYMPASVIARKTEAELQVIPSFVEVGVVDRAMGLGVVCFDEAEVREVGPDTKPSDVGLRSWCVAKGVSGISFVELWSSDGRALWNPSSTPQSATSPTGSSAAKQPPAAAASSEPAVDEAGSYDVDENLAEIAEYVGIQVAAGASVAQIVDALEGDADDLIEDLDEFIDGFVVAHKERQREWSTPTDCDRLDQAFASLAEAGIVSCDPYDLEVAKVGVHNSVDSAMGSGEYRGYVFHTDQAVEMVLEGGGLWLNHGVRKESDEDGWRRIGDEVMQALAQHGLSAEWSAEPNSTIRVDLEWRSIRH